MPLMMQPMQAEGGYNMLTGQGVRERSSFSSHFDQKLEAVVARNRDKLGVRGETQSLGENREDRLSSLLQKDKEGRAENERAAAILSIFLQDLQEVAKQKDLGPGEWEVSITDRDALKELALDAGMTEGQLGAVMDKLGGGDNSLNVNSILESLDRQLRDIEEGRITVPETRLPFLESLLTKMGVDSSRIRELAADAVTGDNRLDLGKFLQGLRDMDSDPAKLSGETGKIKLSEWENRQLFNLLSEAGVDRSLRNKLFPELNLKNFMEQSSGKNEGPESSLNLDRLKKILQAGVENARDSQPRVKVPKFLADLEKVLGQAQFNDKSAGWSKVVQETVDSLFRDVQKMVDMSRIQIQKATGNEDELLLGGLLRQSGEKSRMLNSKWFSSFHDKKEGSVEKIPGGNSRAAQKSDFWQDMLMTTSVRKDFPHNFLSEDTETFNFNHMAKPDNQSSLQIMQNGRIMGRPPQQLSEQVMQQISSGVMRGLTNRQHNLVLRLNPPEMGEVKVDLQVRNDHVSVTFNMENARVKDILEGNMQNFRDSMGQKGFSLDDCSVFVGQEDSSREKKQFEDLFQRRTGSREVIDDEENPVLAPFDMEGERTGDNRGKDGISLIV
ncbi:MAG: flagellar hook-length control protein FliK [Desulfurivibrionaceae bacterium]